MIELNTQPCVIELLILCHSFQAKWKGNSKKDETGEASLSYFFSWWNKCTIIEFFSSFLRTGYPVRYQKVEIWRKENCDAFFFKGKRGRFKSNEQFRNQLTVLFPLTFRSTFSPPSEAESYYNQFGKWSNQIHYYWLFFESFICPRIFWDLCLDYHLH